MESCDCDMELQPEVADASIVPLLLKRLTDKADAAGLQPEDLDELIHDLLPASPPMSIMVGAQSQIAYLVEGLGAEQTERQIDELIAQRQRQQEGGVAGT